jgi:ribosomal protein L37E
MVQGDTPEDELYSVACIECGKKVFKFSKNYLSDCGELTLVCSSCGETTKVTGNGEIRRG